MPFVNSYNASSNANNCVLFFVACYLNLFTVSPPIEELQGLLNELMTEQCNLVQLSRRLNSFHGNMESSSKLSELVQPISATLQQVAQFSSTAQSAFEKAQIQLALFTSFSNMMEQMQAHVTQLHHLVFGALNSGIRSDTAPSTALVTLPMTSGLNQSSATPSTLMHDQSMTSSSSNQPMPSSSSSSNQSSSSPASANDQPLLPGSAFPIVPFFDRVRLSTGRNFPPVNTIRDLNSVDSYEILMAIREGRKGDFLTFVQTYDDNKLDQAETVFQIKASRAQPEAGKSTIRTQSFTVEERIRLIGLFSSLPIPFRFPSNTKLVLDGLDKLITTGYEKNSKFNPNSAVYVRNLFEMETKEVYQRMLIGMFYFVIHFYHRFDLRESVTLFVCCHDFFILQLQSLNR
jgi:hypothetical protein